MVRVLSKTAVFLLFIANFQSRTLAQEAPEYQLKAAFLYNFAKFTEWPATAFEGSTAPLVIGVLGDDPFGEAIKLVEGKPVKGRKLEVKLFKRIEDVKNCHILFISSSETGNLPEILKAVGDSTVLTVGEVETFLESGGVIRFALAQDKLGFEVSSSAVKQARFKISSQLLKFARLVTPEGDTRRN